MRYSSLFSRGGHSKNFLNLVKNLSYYLIVNNFDSFIISFSISKKDIAENKTKISKNEYLKCYKIKFFMRIFPAGNIFYHFFEFLGVVTRLFIFLAKYRPSLIYCYADIPLIFIFFWKKIFGFKLIFDMRGDIINEWKIRGKNKVKFFLLKQLNQLAMYQADLVLSVSSRYSIQNKGMVYPKFNYFDGDIFYYDETQAKLKRQKMKLEDKFIFVYTGNTAYYQMIEENLKFFIQFYKKFNDVFLIIITEHDQDTFTQILKRNNIPNSLYLIKSLPQNEIAALQSIANFGLLIRDDLPLNHHSFPTKFAEYLASGVPVLTTPHIHTIAPLVIENKLGKVIELKSEYSEDIEDIYHSFHNNYELKLRCSIYAQQHLMWQRKAKDIFQVIDNI